MPFPLIAPMPFPLIAPMPFPPQLLLLGFGSCLRAFGSCLKKITLTALSLVLFSSVRTG